MNSFNVRAEVKEWSRKCYGGYVNMCKENFVTPVPYHKFSEMIIMRYSVKEIFRILHEENS